jgi:hypothetical protein
MLKPTMLLLFGALTLVSCQKDESSLSELGRPTKKDVTAPKVRITSPVDGSAVWNTQLTVETSDDMAIGGLEIYQDDVWMNSVNLPENGRAITNHTFSAFYNPGLPDIRRLKAVATDRAGNKSQHEITVYKLVCCGPNP